MNCHGQRGNWSCEEGCARLAGASDRSRHSVATVRHGRGRASFVVAVHVKVLVVGAAIREPMHQSRIAVEVATTGPQPRFEGHDRASAACSTKTLRLVSSPHDNHACSLPPSVCEIDMQPQPLHEIDHGAFDRFHLTCSSFCNAPRLYQSRRSINDACSTPLP
jgi:hypothetical protein